MFANGLPTPVLQGLSWYVPYMPKPPLKKGRHAANC